MRIGYRMAPARAALSARVIVGASLLACAHFALGPLLTGPVRPSLLMIGLLMVVVRLQPGTAALLGLLAGVVVDALAPSAFGAGMFSLTVVAYVASWATASFVADQLLLLGAFMLVGSWAGDLLYLLAGGGTVGALSLVARLLWSLVSAIVTALLAMGLSAVFQPTGPVRRS